MDNRFEQRDTRRGDASGKDRKPKGKHFFKGPRRKQCRFCTEENVVIDYKNVSLLRQFMTERAKIIPRRTTGTCAKHQRKLTTAVKRARILALVPFTVE